MSLIRMLTDLVDADPDAIAVLDVLGGTRRPVSRAELLARSQVLAAELHDRGLSSGDCIAVWLPNWSDALCWQFAASAVGAHVIGINTRYNVDEVAHVLDRARPKVIALAHDFHGLDLITRLRQAAGRTTAAAPALAIVAGPGGAEVTDPGRYDVGAGVWIPRTIRSRSPSPPRARPDEPSSRRTASRRSRRTRERTRERSGCTAVTSSSALCPCPGCSASVRRWRHWPAVPAVSSSRSSTRMPSSVT
jgi:acyl-CoA synthetase (AMP-forming)/AMP-acid ligase II